MFRRLFVQSRKDERSHALWMETDGSVSQQWINQLLLMPYLARGSGLIWKCMTMGGVPFPVSIWKGVRVLVVAQRPRPFHPALASSMRPSSHFEYTPIGYGTRRTTHFPSFKARYPSDSLPVALGVLL